MFRTIFFDTQYLICVFRCGFHNGNCLLNFDLNKQSFKRKIVLQNKTKFYKKVFMFETNVACSMLGVYSRSKGFFLWVWLKWYVRPGLVLYLALHTKINRYVFLWVCLKWYVRPGLVLNLTLHTKINKYVFCGYG